MERDIVLAGACRTAIGSYGGSLADIPAVDLGAFVIRAALERAGIPSRQVDHVIMGCVLQATEGQNPARQAALKAGLPVDVPAQTLNMTAGSGLQSVNMAAALIKAGMADVVVAGGMENMSMAPYALNRARFGYHLNNGTLIDTLSRDILWDPHSNSHIGMAAENIAEKYSITRQMQDMFAVGSHQKYEAAYSAGKYMKEIVPFPVKEDQNKVEFASDESPKSGLSLDDMLGYKALYKKNGTVTEANCSTFNDGGAAVIVMSSQKARELGVLPMAKFLGCASSGVDPSLAGFGAAVASRKVLEQLGLNICDIQRIEADETYGVQVLAAGQLLGWDFSRVNVNGGGIAMGHPAGATGCRMLVSLLHEMRFSQTQLGLVTISSGSGLGVASVVENI